MSNRSISNEIIKNIAQEHYQLTLNRIRLLGISENHAFEVEDCTKSKYFARIHVYSELYENYLSSEYELLEIINRSFPNISILGIRTLKGTYSVKFEYNGEHYLFMLFNWVEGKHISGDDLTTDEAVMMAETTAKFHTISQKTTQNLNRPIYDYEFYCGKNSFFNRNDLLDHIPKNDIAVFYVVKDLFKNYSKNHSYNNLGLIHYDLHLGNYLFDNGNAKIIDFDECGYGYYLFDLGHILFAQQGHKNYSEIETVFIERYESITCREIVRKDLEMFKGVQAIALIHYFFRLYDRTKGENNLFCYVPDMSNSLKRILNQI